MIIEADGEYIRPLVVDTLQTSPLLILAAKKQLYKYAKETSLRNNGASLRRSPQFPFSRNIAASELLTNPSKARQLLGKQHLLTLRPLYPSISFARSIKSNSVLEVVPDSQDEGEMQDDEDDKHEGSDQEGDEEDEYKGFRVGGGLRGTGDIDRAEWQRAKAQIPQNGEVSGPPEPGKRPGLYVYQTTEFVCSACMKGGFCFRSMKVALGPDILPNVLQGTTLAEVRNNQTKAVDGIKENSTAPSKTAKEESAAVRRSPNQPSFNVSPANVSLVTATWCCSKYRSLRPYT
ncbi:hypothetical protein FPV67DRAFT_1667402 [Lyophyllum atratum]|nr:hypothetical protein FPV67DRAFT_1667402 [Lyophyllum atratum]